MNQSLFPFDVLSRWIHVGTVVVLVGGTAFVRFVLLPVSEQLEDSVREQLHQAVAGRWKRFVHAGIVLILLSGLYNYVRGAAVHKGDGLYHAFIGMKMVLAAALFFLASVLVGRSPAFHSLRRNRRLWLGVIVTLAGVIISISGCVKVRGVPVGPSDPAPGQAAGVIERDERFAGTAVASNSPLEWGRPDA